MNKYIKNGKYTASQNDFIYYEVGSRTFWARRDGHKIECYYGATSGGGEYYTITGGAQNHIDTLLSTAHESGKTTRTKRLLQYIMPLSDEIVKVKNDIVQAGGIPVYFKLFDEDGGVSNVYGKVRAWQRQALKQGFDASKVAEVAREAKKVDRFHTVDILMKHCYQ